MLLPLLQELERKRSTYLIVAIAHHRQTSLLTKDLIYTFKFQILLYLSMIQVSPAIIIQKSFCVF